jgi:hypothetical protein
MSQGLLVRRPRLGRALELVVCAVLATALAVLGLWKMDYLNPATAHHIRMTDSTRTAYVAKNIAEGRGYTTNELPAWLLNFYEARGKLHAETWVNADRFPFTAYAVAALYTITGSTSEEVGILGYNTLCWVAFVVLLYWLTRSVWNDRWAALFAVGIALVHPLTYVYLYLKDADMLLLTTGILAAFFGYFARLPEQLSRKRAVVMGTLLGWMYLARPNIGMGFILFFGLVLLRRLWRGYRAKEFLATLRVMLRREGLAVAAIAAWCLPFVIHSMREWGSPFFSANAVYQLPLGTKYAMNTDTWWKYAEPGTSVTIGTLLHNVPDQLLAKFTTSWIVTLKVILRAYAIELLLGLGALAWLTQQRRVLAEGEPLPPTDGDERERVAAVRGLAAMMGFTVLINFLALPLYGYQNYGYRHYLSFFLPFIWLLCGQAIVLLLTRVRPVIEDGLGRVRARPGLWILIAIVAVLLWNANSGSQEANQLFARTADFVGAHWLTSAAVLALLVWRRTLLRRPGFLHVVVIVATIVVVRHRPYLETKRLNLNWFPANTAVWDILRQRHGLVMSFAMQSEVNWVSGRKNIPAPENILHAYSFLIDHQLEVEDVYIESAETMLGPWDGPFYYAAPGFETYARMQRYHGRLPGYEVVFDEASMKGYPKFRVKPRPKASTVYRLVDRTAAAAMGKSPRVLNLGAVDDVVYTTHGWGDYFTIDGRPVVAATDASHRRYVQATEKPWEDTAVSFFLDDQRPTVVDLEVYATHATKLEFYWNLDLYAYDDPRDRYKHQLATYEVKTPGWQHIRLDVPTGATRRGYNKLGFHVGTFQLVTVCPKTFADAACAQLRPKTDDAPLPGEAEPPVLVVRDDLATQATSMKASLFVTKLSFTYAP